MEIYLSAGGLRHRWRADKVRAWLQPQTWCKNDCWYYLIASKHSKCQTNKSAVVVGVDPYLIAQCRQGLSRAHKIIFNTKSRLLLTFLIEWHFIRFLAVGLNLSVHSELYASTSAVTPTFGSVTIREKADHTMMRQYEWQLGVSCLTYLSWLSHHPSDQTTIPPVKDFRLNPFPDFLAQLVFQKTLKISSKQHI